MRKLFVFCVSTCVMFVIVSSAMAQVTDEPALSNLQMWNLIAGFLSPLVIAGIIQTGWSKFWQASSALAFSAVIALVTTALEGELTFQDWITSALTVAVATIVFYQGFWKPTKIAPKIEEKTNLSKS